MSDPRRLLVAIGDMHAGGSVAAFRKPIQHQDGPIVHPGPVNQLLAEQMERGAEWAAKEARTLGGAGADIQGSIPVVLLHNGDLTEGIHHDTHQILFAEAIGPQLEIAHDLLSIWLTALNPMSIVFTIGTEAHVGKGGAFEDAVAKRLESEGWPVQQSNTGRVVAQNWLLNLAGHRILCIHHGKMGGTSGTTGSLLSLKAAQFAFQELKANHERRKRGEDESPVPDLVIGSHFHQKAESGNEHPIAWIQLPCWTFRNSFAHRVAATSQEHIGLATVYCDPENERPVHRWKLWQPRREECPI